MKPRTIGLLVIVIILSACTPATIAAPTNTTSPTQSFPSSTPRNLMLPTWTPSPTLPPEPSRTPRPTNTPLAASETRTSQVVDSGTGWLIDRPTYAILNKPVNLVTMQYDPTFWALNTAYPSAFMGYSLTHRSIYDCKIDPSAGIDATGYEVEQYNRPMGKTPFAIARLSKAGTLYSASYCTGEGEDETCYVVTPGDDHAACLADAEAVLSSFQMIANPFLEPVITAPNNWICKDQTGIEGHCSISYSIPLNTITYTNNGEGWAAGEDGLIYHLINQTWMQATSPTTQPIYDMSFSSPTNGWAVGKGAQVLHWDGNAWIEVIPFHGEGEGPGGSTQILYGVEAISNDEAWMVGTMKDISGKNMPYALHWNASDLVEETAFPDCNCGLNAVMSLGEEQVLAVGSSALGAIAMRWDGSTWSSTVIAGADALYTVERGEDGLIWAGGIEYARDRSDTRGALFKWDGSTWHRVSLPPLTGGIYQVAILQNGQVAVGGDFSALWTGNEWQPIMAGLAGYGWIVDMEADSQGALWALTHSGNIFQLEISGE